MNNSVLLLTKDALSKEYLPQYGNKYWSGKTPNLDELCKKGTIFENYYTSAPSTVMSFRGMMFGKFAHETPYKDYSPKEIPIENDSFFGIAKARGYKCHIIWDSAWIHMVLRYGNCFGKHVKIHNIDNIRQGVGAHYKHEGKLQRDDMKSQNAIIGIENEVKLILSDSDKHFIWIHLPHVINGRTGYGDDIDLFDDIIGVLRNYFEDNNIYISADHGNMNGFRDKYCYGFDVYPENTNIPLITPKIQGLSLCNTFVSNIDLKEIIFNSRIPERKYIYSDTQYYAQPNRKLAIISDGFLYIYNKRDATEELYDLIYNNDIRCNMMQDTFYDFDRELYTYTRELFFSPRWDEAIRYRDTFRKERLRIWREPTKTEGFKERIIMFSKRKAVKILKFIKDIIND